MAKKILTIAGSDPFAGGGLQADLKTFENHRLFGLSALTCIAVVEAGEFIVHDIPSKILADQLQTIFATVALDGIKIGLIHSLENIAVIQHYLKETPVPIVLDPVLAFKETPATYQQDYSQALQELFPLATVVTPNLREAELLTGMAEITTLSELTKASEKILATGAKNVVVKGGSGLPGEVAYDLLNGEQQHLLAKPKLNTVTINGAGCTFASAIASNLVLERSLEEAVRQSKEYVYQAIKNGVKITEDSGNVWFGGCQKTGGRK